jgi:hypothetical protein
MTDGLTNLTVTALAIDPQATRLYAATNGEGVFAVTLETPHFMLTASTAGLGNGTVTSTPGGIDCGWDCSESYAADTTVTLTATPAFGSVFTGWDGCDEVSGNSCVVTINEARSVTARFLGVPLPPRFR